MWVAVGWGGGGEEVEGQGRREEKGQKGRRKGGMGSAGLGAGVV